MSQQAGWYDDPENDNNLRYWDGVEWTNHISPKRNPHLDKAGQAAQAAESGWQDAPGPQTGQGYGQVRPGEYGQQDQGGLDAHAQRGGWPAQHGGAPGAQPPFQGQQWQQPMPGGFQAHAPGPRDVTPDGQPLARWWHRVGARLIDAVLIGAVGLLIADWVVPGYFQNLTEWAMSGGSPTEPMPVELEDQQRTWTLAVGGLALVYEIVTVTLLGGSLGKLATGLRIRLREAPGKLGWSASVLRALIYQGVGMLASIFAALSFLGLFNLINVLWPLWDPYRQAIHDKVAKTNVVRVRR